MQLSQYDFLRSEINKGRIFPELIAMIHCANYVYSQNGNIGDKLISNFEPITYSNYADKRTGIGVPQRSA